MRYKFHLLLTQDPVDIVSILNGSIDPMKKVIKLAVMVCTILNVNRVQ
jgi:hypothetical protein